MGFLIAIPVAVFFIIIEVIVPLVLILHQIRKDRKTENIQFVIDDSIYRKTKEPINTYKRYNNNRGLKDWGLNRLFRALQRKGYSVYTERENIYIVN
jgi:hypothetical protein